MNNPVLNDIKKQAINLLNSNYGYCGMAESDSFVLLNSDDGNGNDIIIRIEIKPEE